MKPISRYAQDRMLAALADYGACPKTSATVAALTHYTPSFVRWVLHLLAAQEVIVQDGGTGQLVLWSLPPDPPPMRTCRTCGLDKPADTYHREPKRRDGLKPDCPACRTEAASIRYRRLHTAA